MTAVTQAIKRKWNAGPLLEEWLIIEYPDGTLENMGLVQAQMLAPVPRIGDFGMPELNAPYQFQWRTLDHSRQAAVLLNDASRDESGAFRHPYLWPGPEGVERWYLGPHAYRKAVEAGWLRP